jgi:hypothetical protein
MTDQQYLEALLTQRKRRRFSISGCIVWLASGVIFVVTLAVMAPQIAATYPVPVLSSLFATPQSVFGTAVPTGQQPRGAPAWQGGAAPWPTLTPTREVEQPTLTVPVVPTPTAGFWNPTEIAAFTATVEAFYRPETLPTAPADFAKYVDERCRDAGAVEKSRTLQLFCGGGE